MTHTRTSRRRFLATTTAAGLAGTAWPRIVTRARAASKNELVFVGFGGTYQEGQVKAYIEPFERETGIKVIQTTGVDLAKLKAQVQSKNVEWDLVTLPDRLRYTAVRDGLLAPINYNIVNAKDILREVVTDHAVGHVTVAMMLTYAKTGFTAKAPQTWLDFWDPANFPGPRGMYNFPAYSTEIALIADGVPKEKLYPLDIQRAFRSFDRIKSDIKVWWTQFPQPGVLLKTGEIAMTPWTRTITQVLAGDPFGFSYEGAAITYEAWTVPHGAPHAENAMKFINFALQPQRQAELTKYISFGPTNRQALPLVDPKLLPLLPSAPENIKKGFLLSGDWWGPNLQRVQEQWNEWRLR
jgi:putative spermidine/putrescine transport system substrate-binding protein